jgi:galactokinase
MGKKGILLIDSMVKHELASSEYNTRRKQCEAGVRMISKYNPGVKSLRDVSLEELFEYENELGADVFKRCRYVIAENDRVIKACEDLENNRIESFGAKMYETHKGLRIDYEVTCPELDFLVDQTHSRNEVYGARMMGGGFGGCTVNLVELSEIPAFKKYITTAYVKKFDIKPEFYEVEIKDGVTEIL